MALMRICFFVILCGISLMMPAVAEEKSAAKQPNQISDSEKEFGKKFLPMTSSFGFSELAFSAKAPNGLLLYEYLQPGQDIKKWQFLSTVSILPVGKTKEEGDKELARFLAFFKKQVPKILEEKEFDAAFGKIYYTSYEVGDGPLKENNLSAIWQVAPGLIANFQIQKRGGAHNQGGIDTFKNYLTAMAKKSQEKKT